MKKQLQLTAFLLISGFAAINAQLEYKDVAGIFNARCASCHHAGSVSPALNFYTSISGYTGVIAYNLNTNRMPPWMPDTTYSRFSHERIITAPEKNKILAWISSGAASGDTSLAPIAPNYPLTKLNGTPDLILTIPSFTSNATTSDKYNCFSIPFGLLQNRVLRAYEILPNDKSMIHHAVLNIDTIGNTVSDLTGGCYSQGGNFSIGDYAPGADPIVFPNSMNVKFGIEIKAGSQLVVQMHYPAGSVGKVDNTQIRLFFYPVGTPNIRPMYATTPIQNWTFFINANSTKTVTINYPTSAAGLSAPISLFSIFPHSHRICTSIENWASNGTTTIPLCKIPKWNFDWQGFYAYKNLVKIPSGYKLYGKHVFDNTTNNPYHLPQTITAGLSTTNEMIFDGIIFSDYKVGDELINIDSILSVEPLLQAVNLVTLNKTNESINVYPNPFSDKVVISYELTSNQITKLTIINAIGQEVAVMSAGFESIGKHSYEWNGKSASGATLATGLYNYKLQIGDKSLIGKIIFKSKN